MNINLEAAVKRIAVHGPDRIVVNDDGYAMPQKAAFERYCTTWSIVFIRDDGWSLGCPHIFEPVAYSQWKDHWTHYMLRGDDQARPITQYPNR